MQLLPWAHPTREGFTLRGWHTPPSGRPLLHFLHGNGFCGRTYEPLLRHLSADFDLWLSDAQGHGDSDHGGAFVGWNRSAELAWEALQRQGQAFREVPHLAVGHSFGGVLTGLLLGTQLGHFRRAVLLDPVLFPPAMLMGMALGGLAGLMKHTPLARQARARRPHWPDRAAAFAALHGRGAYRGWADDALRAFVDHALKDRRSGGVELKCQPSREAEVFSSAPERMWTLLGRVRTPTLVLHGQDSFPFVADGVRHWQLMHDGIQAECVPGGHSFMQEQPAPAAQRVRDYLLAD